MQYSFLQAALLGSAIFLPFAAAAGTPPPSGTSVGSQMPSAPTDQPTPECTKVALTNVMMPRENNPCPPGQAPKKAEGQQGEHEKPGKHGKHGQHGHHGQHGQHGGMNGKGNKEHKPAPGGFHPQKPPTANPSNPGQPEATTTSAATTTTTSASGPAQPTPPTDGQTPPSPQDGEQQQQQPPPSKRAEERMTIETVPNPSSTPAPKPKPNFHCKKLGGPQRPVPLANDASQGGEAEAIVQSIGGTEMKCPPGYIMVPVGPIPKEA